MSRGLIRDDVTDTAGNAIQGVQVTVYNAGTVVKPTLYDSSVGGSILSNPLTTDANGVFQAFVGTGEYDVSVAAPSGTVVVSNVPVLDADDINTFDADVATVQQLAADMTTLYNTGYTQVQRSAQLGSAATGSVFTLPFTYLVGSERLRVFHEGVLLDPDNGDYNETSGTTVTINNAFNASDEFVFLGSIPINNSAVTDAANVTHTALGQSVEVSLNELVRRVPGNDAADLASALAANDVVRIQEGQTVTLLTPVTVGGNKRIIGDGKDLSTIRCEVSGAAGLVFENNTHGGMSDLTIRNNDGSGGCIELREVSGNCLSNTFRDIRFVGRDSGDPAFTDTDSIAVYGKGAAGGQSNYFHRFTDCDFDSFYAGFSAEDNANAWIGDGLKFQKTLFPFDGDFSEWIMTNLWWHSTSGSSPDYATFVRLTGTAQYNRFELFAEPGTTFTRLYDLGASTFTNVIRGGVQVTQLGVDAGSTNVFDLPLINRFLKCSEYKFRTGDTRFNDDAQANDGDGDVTFFGDGTNAHSGAGFNKVRVFGRSSATRHLSIEQTAGDAIIASNVAGGVKFQGVGGVDAGKFDENATAGNTRFLIYDVDNGTLERVSVGAADSGGSGFKVLRIPN